MCVIEESKSTQPKLKAGAFDGGDLVKGRITFQVGIALTSKSLKLRYEEPIY